MEDTPGSRRRGDLEEGAGIEATYYNDGEWIGTVDTGLDLG